MCGHRAKHDRLPQFALKPQLNTQSKILRMSFDLYLQRFQAGCKASADKAGLLSLLRSHSVGPPDEFGFYVIKFSDGSSVELSASGLESEENFTSCAFHLREFSPHVISFIFDVASETQMVILNTQGEDSETSPSLLLLQSTKLDDLPSDIGFRPVYYSSSEDLSRKLGLGIEGWKSYRMQVVSSAE